MPEKQKSWQSSGRSLKDFLVTTLTDPVLLYTSLVMMSLMFHFRDRTIDETDLSKAAEFFRDYHACFIYGVLTYAVGWLVFRFFDFMRQHVIMGALGYIIISIVFLRSASYAIRLGYEDYPISWGVWFLTPQESLEYNKWYTIGLYILFLIFMLSVIYYFTRVRYRILMNFLIFVIPFAVYGKEYEKMPTGFIILMAVGYILLMVYFRQLSDSKPENASEVEIKEKKLTWRSAGRYILTFAIIAAVIPKPEIEADRSYIETLINAEAFTDRLVAMLNVFRDSADGDQFRNNNDTAPVYYASAPEPLRLKLSTFSSYDYDTDSWEAGVLDTSSSVSVDMPAEIWTNGGVAEAVLLAAELDSGFAEEFGLSEFIEQVGSLDIVKPETASAVFYGAQEGGSAAPVPQSAVSMDASTYKELFTVGDSGTVYAEKGTFRPGTEFSFSYQRDGYFSVPENVLATETIAGADDYESLLYNAYYALTDEYWRYAGSTEGLENDEYYQRLRRCRKTIEANIDTYPAITGELLDYGGNERIYQLAQELTAGLDSEYEKAEVLELYFYRNGYNYDLEYVKADGENAEDFIFETKTGVCYEYATAMTLLARAAGIPARYCEGYNMSQRYQQRNGFEGFIVRAQDAHGFPELYIKGYGWLSFEPTMTDAVRNTSGSTKSSLSRIGLFILAAAVLLLLLIAVMPVLSHKLFLISSRRRSPSKQAAAAMRRICRIYDIGSTSTSHEAVQLVADASGADISAAAVLFDRAVYGGEELSEAEGQRITEEYTKAWEALREAKKKARKEALRLRRSRTHE